MEWQLKIQEPSGEMRRHPIQGSLSLGRDPQADVVLRDPTAPWWVGTLSALEGRVDEPGRAVQAPFWIKIPEASPPGRIGDLSVREALIPSGIPLRIGETTITLESRTPQPVLPEFPSGAKPWLTCSDAGRETLWNAKKAAHTPLSIFLSGETGTGKEVLAHLIHSWSDRRSGAFVPINCAALPLSLVESELFGHVKGAFTGAMNHRPGALMQAHGGTLFLDEIGDLPMDIQVKLLRFLENGEIRPVGADRPSRVDVRLVCATHLPLIELVQQKKFRQDLFYRIASVTVTIPTLRSRPEDIELLARTFALGLNRSLSPRAMLRLQAHAWPGNVRELQHAIERACGLAGPFSPVLGEDAFEFLLNRENVCESPQLELGSPVLSLKEMERVLLLKSLRLTRGNRTQAARVLGVARSTLFEMLKRHHIQGPRTAVLDLTFKK